MSLFNPIGITETISLLYCHLRLDLPSDHFTTCLFGVYRAFFPIDCATGSWSWPLSRG